MESERQLLLTGGALQQILHRYIANVQSCKLGAVSDDNYSAAVCHARAE